MTLTRDDRKQAVCELCGEPMPPGEEMFRFHGFGTDCPRREKKVWTVGPSLESRYFRKGELNQHLRDAPLMSEASDYRDMTPYERGVVDGLNIAKSICGELKTGTVRDAIEHIERRITNGRL